MPSAARWLGGVVKAPQAAAETTIDRHTLSRLFTGVAAFIEQPIWRPARHYCALASALVVF